MSDAAPMARREAIRTLVEFIDMLDGLVPEETRIDLEPEVARALAALRPIAKEDALMPDDLRERIALAIEARAEFYRAGTHPEDAPLRIAGLREAARIARETPAEEPGRLTPEDVGAEIEMRRITGTDEV